MKRAEKLGVLLGVLGIVCTATLAALHVEEQREQIRSGEEVILTLPEDSVQGISWTYEGQTLRFQRDPEWQYTEDAAFPVSEERIGALLALFQELGASLTIEDVEDYGQYGLDKPLCTIDLETEAQTYQIQLGDYSTLDAKRYLSIGDGKVYLTETDLLDHFSVGLESMIDHDEVPILEQVTKLQFSGDVHGEIFYEEDSGRTYSDDDVYFLQTDGEPLVLDSAKVSNYLQAVSALTPTNYVSYHAEEAELQTYGLDSPDLTITAEYGSGEEEFVLHISQEPAASEADSDEDAPCYMRVGDSPIIYTLSAGEYETLMAADYDDLRHGEVFWGDFEEIIQADVSLDGRTYTLPVEKDGDSLVFSYQDTAHGTDAFRYALENVTAVLFTEEEPRQKLEISLTLYLSHEDSQRITVDLYRYDGSHCLAVIDGSPGFLTARSGVVDLIEAVHEIVLDETI